MIYALREALRIVQEEGLEDMWARHRRNSLALIDGIEALGMRMHANRDYRLPSLNAITIPKGVSDENVRKILLNDFNVEIGGGLGVLKGKIWRTGLMGMNSCERSVIMVLEALEYALAKEGFPLEHGKGFGAAMEFYKSK